MGRATEEQVRKLEEEHKKQLANIVLSNNLWVAIIKNIPGSPKEKGFFESKTYKQWLSMGVNIRAAFRSWLKRQQKFEKAGIDKFDPVFEKYLLSDKIEDQQKLTQYAKDFVTGAKRQSLKGIGFIPLIIWGVLAIIGMFTAETIVDELNTTTEEKESLINKTAETLKALNVPPEQAAEILQQSTKEQPGMFENIQNLLFMVGLGYLAITFIKNESKKAAA